MFSCLDPISMQPLLWSDISGDMATTKARRVQRLLLEVMKETSFAYNDQKM